MTLKDDLRRKTADYSDGNVFFFDCWDYVYDPDEIQDLKDVTQDFFGHSDEELIELENAAYRMTEELNDAICDPRNADYWQ